MSDNWIVQNLENALNTWNEKLSEIWSLITQSPETFKGGSIWNVVVNIHGALQAIGYALLVLFFVNTAVPPFPNRTPAVKTVSSLLTILHLIIKVPMASTQTAGLTIRHPLLLTQWQVLIQMKQLIM